ncbi:hypothetical protein LB553_20520 [Mesorhizobium sp. CA8]|uniref:hypothetical protein n=1 Tax=unclassified Mesorhizobium TaxID=325217 RepID=UPI001CCA758E|nr:MULTISPECIES: hypothetical protein [unclassified Mesorhizobium]MBZ9763248.1 hypothetical protein [Mesorhizobium sp. CA8]MBZ9819120.1 hypothetical protein [Mesorhizobium sp. CA4]
MLTKILAASALTIGLATAAMAQTAGTTSGNDSTGGSGQTITVDPKTPATPSPDQMAPPDTGTTGSISGGDKNCPNSPQGSMGDASSSTAGTMQPNVNDKTCGK